MKDKKSLGQIASLIVAYILLAIAIIIFLRS